MKDNRIKGILIGLAVLLGLGAFSVYAVTNYGSEEDPLITKSYLDTVVKDELQQTMRTELEAALADVQTSDGLFTLLTLSEGQRVTAAVGTELILRFGSATAYAYDSNDAALVDTTTAEVLGTGAALAANHLCMVTIEGNGFTASADGTKVLISGVYSVN